MLKYYKKSQGNQFTEAYLSLGFFLFGVKIFFTF